MAEPQISNLDNAAKALGRLPSGLAIACTGTKSAPLGFLASWIQQASFNPLRITLAVAKDRAVNATLSQPGQAFSIQILDKDGSHLMKPFFGKTPPFEHLNWEWADPIIVLPEALAYLHCQVVSKIDAGDHDLILANVVNGKLLKEGAPLTHTRGTALNY